jgi:hypothetical protein
MDDLFFGS